MNPSMGGETLYQESRRLVSAAWQHTVYNEWLPVVMGPEGMRQYALNLESDGFYNGMPSWAFLFSYLKASSYSITVIVLL